MKKRVYKIEMYQKTKGWEVMVMFLGGESLTYCFSTTKQMIKFLNKKAV